MKKQLFILLALVGFGLGACERHDWETKDGKLGTEEFFKHAPVDDKDGQDKKEAH